MPSSFSDLFDNIHGHGWLLLQCAMTGICETDGIVKPRGSWGGIHPQLPLQGFSYFIAQIRPISTDAKQKQNLRIKSFVGTRTNALKIQIWTTLGSDHDNKLITLKIVSVRWQKPHVTRRKRVLFQALRKKPVKTGIESFGTLLEIHFANKMDIQTFSRHRIPFTSMPESQSEYCRPQTADCFIWLRSCLNRL